MEKFGNHFIQVGDTNAFQQFIDDLIHNKDGNSNANHEASWEIKPFSIAASQNDTVFQVSESIRFDRVDN